MPVVNWWKRYINDCDDYSAKGLLSNYLTWHNLLWSWLWYGIHSERSHSFANLSRGLLHLFWCIWPSRGLSHFGNPSEAAIQSEPWIVDSTWRIIGIKQRFPFEIEMRLSFIAVHRVYWLNMWSILMLIQCHLQWDRGAKLPVLLPLRIFIISVIFMKLPDLLAIHEWKITLNGQTTTFINLPNRMWGLLGPQRTKIVHIFVISSLHLLLLSSTVEQEIFATGNFREYGP